MRGLFRKRHGREQAALSGLRHMLGPAAEGLSDDEVLRGVEALSRAAAGAGMTPAELAADLTRGADELQAWSRRRALRAIDGDRD